MEQISCPTCSRDFEIPRRYMIHEGDFDFKPLPRMLSCLHTVCHSCLEDQRERSKKGMVSCPICRTKDVVKGVRYLPLDISVLKTVVSSGGTDGISVCAQCYEDVPSFSFCLTCSSSLCEFHHQDHRLSVLTAKHNIHTFKDISYHGLHIDYTFPPVACPEVPMQDCSLYCEDCMHLISPQAMIENHRDHQVEDYKEILPAMELRVVDSAAQSKQNSAELAKRISVTQEQLRQLDLNEESTTAEIGRIFNLLHRKLESRERELLDRMDQVVQEKRFVLTEQLSLLSDLNEDCMHAARVAEAILADTKNKPVEGMYLVAATETIEFRSDALNEQLNIKLKDLLSVDPTVSVQFSTVDAGEVVSLIKSFGAIVSTIGGDSADLKDGRKTAWGEDSALKPVLPNIRFTVKVQSEQASKASNEKHIKSNEIVVVEAHLVDTAKHRSIADSLKRTPKKGGFSRTAQRDQDNDEPPRSSAPAEDTLLGRVVIHTDIDRKLLSRHELHSYFESSSDPASGLPVLKVLKELVSAQ